MTGTLKSSTNFNGQTTVEQLNESMNAMLLLHSSCQGLIEAEIQEVSSSWYNQLEQELGEAEMLVVHWRENGFLYFREDILAEVISFGEAFLSSQTEINNLFSQLESNFSQDVKDQIVAKLNSFKAPIQSMSDQIETYQSKLQEFGENMQKPHSEMNTTIAEIQAQEAEIKSEIATINQEIANLKKQIETDREAISKAKKARTSGIVETIFGVLLAPVTGGASLILAGIGVASITEAEDKINSMKSQISQYQGKIASDQTNLNNDQKTVATLNGLSMSTGIVITDMNLIDGALDSLKVTWSLLGDELAQVIEKLNASTNAQEAIVGNAWYQAACNEWNVVLKQAQDLNGKNLPAPNHETIG